MCLVNPEKIEIGKDRTCYKVVKPQIYFKFIGGKKTFAPSVYSPLNPYRWDRGKEQHTGTERAIIWPVSEPASVAAYGSALNVKSVINHSAFHSYKTIEGAVNLMKRFLEEDGRPLNEFLKRYAIAEFKIPVSSRFVYEGFHTYDNQVSEGEGYASEGLTYVKTIKREKYVELLKQ